MIDNLRVMVRVMKPLRVHPHGQPHSAPYLSNRLIAKQKVFVLFIEIDVLVIN